jgi:hypothetical protein
MNSNINNTDDLLTLNQVAQAAPVPTSYFVVWGWCRRGVRTRSGTRIRLPHVRIGQRLYVKRGDLLLFGEAVAEADVAAFDISNGPRKRTRHQRSDDARLAAVAAAEETLHGAGI